MSLSQAEITDLLRRAQLSVLRGYTIARSDYYAQELGGSDDSPAGLVALCRSALEGTEPPAVGAADEVPELPAAEEPKALPEEASPGEPEPASPEPPPEPEPEEEPHDDSSEAYESWSKKKLLAAAAERGLDVKGNNTKAEIISALRGS